jgi:hypothetical protein
MKRLHLKFVLVGLLATALQAQQMEALKVSIVEGQDAVNSITHKVGGPFAVEVRDEKDRIVPGARVQFSTPHAGPTGQVEGSHTFLAWTDTEGRARVHNLVPNSLPGSFPVTVEASFAGRTGTATFNESNSPVETEITRTYSYAKPNHKVRNTLIIAGVVGAAALAIGLSLALSGGGKAVVAPTPTSVSIGGIAVGGPQ